MGKSGLSTLNFLKSKSELYLYDDNKNNTKNPKHKKKIIEYNNLIRSKFDDIIISPGIDINTCRLSNFIKKNLDKLNTDIDIFYSIYNNQY